MTADSEAPTGAPPAERATGAHEWVYESIIRSVPGLNISRRVAIAVQFLGFEGAILLLSWYHGLPNAAIAGTAGVFVAVAGSIFMLGLSKRVRDADSPAAYRRLLFGSRIELVLGLVAFLLLIVYVFIYDPRQPGTPLLEELVGTRPPILISLLLLMIGWDVTYRIGVGWWASVAGLLRTVRYGETSPQELRSRYTRIDAMNITFAGLQLVIVPILAGHPLIQLALVGHVVAVALVSGTSIVLLR